MSQAGRVNIVLGARGCGKTINTEHLKAYFRAEYVFDDGINARKTFQPHDLRDLARRGKYVLVLTSDPKFVSLVRRAFTTAQRKLQVYQFANLPKQARPVNYNRQEA